MSATDDLRRMLDSRGEEHFDGTETTLWGYEQTSESTGFYRFAADERSDGRMMVRLLSSTPSQAVEATLGRGTCGNLVKEKPRQMPMLHCVRCGCLTTLSVPDGGAAYPGETMQEWPRYCAMCGARVVDDE